MQKTACRAFIEEPVLKSIIDKIRQESGIATEFPMDRLVDRSALREAKTELRKRQFQANGIACGAGHNIESAQ